MKLWQVSSLVFLSLLSSIVGLSLIITATRPGLYLGDQPEHVYAYPFTPPKPGENLAKLEQAVAFYRQRIQQNPEDGLDRAALADLYLQMAKMTGEQSWYLLAEQSAQKSLANLPFNNDAAILALARIAEAQHDFRMAIHLTEKVSGEDALALIVTSKLALGDVAAADAAANQLVNFNPSTGSLTLRALTRSARGEKAAALVDFEAAIAAEEPAAANSSAWVRTLMGRFYHQQGNVHLAGQLYREALEILPRYPLALLQLGKLETELGHYRAAERYYSQLRDPLALQGLAQIQRLRGREAAAVDLWAQAEATFRRQIDSNSLGHRRDLARLLLERGHPQDFPEALSLMQAEVRNRRDTETLNLLAWAQQVNHLEPSTTQK